MFLDGSRSTLYSCVVLESMANDVAMREKEQYVLRTEIRGFTVAPRGQKSMQRSAVSRDFR